MPELRFVVALPAEARPLVEHLRLERDPRSTAFKIYRRDGDALIASGPGKTAAAAATAYLHAHLGAAGHAAWINCGIAGHRELAVGEAVVAHKIRDVASGAVFYPPLVFEPPCATEEVLTVDRPERSFAETGCYEMEASGFYATACRFAGAELVHCLKIVSDRPGSDLGALTAASVSELVAARLPALDRLAAECRRLSEEVGRFQTDPAGFDHCLERFRFTTTSRRELRRQLRRRQALASDLELPLDGLAPGARGTEVNRRLSAWLDALPVRLSPSGTPGTTRRATLRVGSPRRRERR